VLFGLVFEGIKLADGSPVATKFVSDTPDDSTHHDSEKTDALRNCDSQTSLLRDEYRACKALASCSQVPAAGSVGQRSLTGRIQ
jgi:hypothetical protein